MSDCRLLIVSNNCLSQHNSNGRTLLNMLGGFKRENLFQIYTSGEYADDKYCAESYRLTNRDVINCYRGIAPAACQPGAADGGQQSTSGALSSRKNAATMLLRDLAWDWNRKLHRSVLEWAADKKPDAVLLQLGDSTHIIRIATELVRKLDLPLITYNTEDYYFKSYDYMRQRMNAGIVYRLFHGRFCRKFKAMMKEKPTCVYNCEGLTELYDSTFGTKSETLFCSTDMTPAEAVKETGGILYAGNLGVGRPAALIEIGELLHERGLCIDVYGNAPDEAKNALEAAPGVQYHGFVSYEETRRNIADSRLLVHVEGFDEYFSRDTRFAFSTKLADYCASGVPVFMYAPAWCESTKYAKKYDLAVVASQKEALRRQLNRALDDAELRDRTVGNAQAAALRNHQIDRNQQRAAELIENACRCKRLRNE